MKFADTFVKVIQVSLSAHYDIDTAPNCEATFSTDYIKDLIIELDDKNSITVAILDEELIARVNYDLAPQYLEPHQRLAAEEIALLV